MRSLGAWELKRRSIQHRRKYGCGEFKNLLRMRRDFETIKSRGAIPNQNKECCELDTLAQNFLRRTISPIFCGQGFFRWIWYHYSSTATTAPTAKATRNNCGLAGKWGRGYKFEYLRGWNGFEWRCSRCYQFKWLGGECFWLHAGRGYSKYKFMVISGRSNSRMEHRESLCF